MLVYVRNPDWLRECCCALLCQGLGLVLLGRQPLHLTDLHTALVHALCRGVYQRLSLPMCKIVPPSTDWALDV